MCIRYDKLGLDALPGGEESPVRQRETRPGEGNTEVMVRKIYYNIFLVLGFIPLDF